MKQLREDEVSASMACTVEASIIHVPLCNGCKKWNTQNDTCNKYPKGIPLQKRRLEYHECDGFELKENSIITDKVKANIKKATQDI